MLRNGIRVLSLWCFLNILPCLASLAMIAMGKHAPGVRMLFSPSEIPSIESRALATIDGLAVVANSAILLLCSLFFLIIQNNVVKKEKWAIYSLTAVGLASQIASAWSDSFFNGQNFPIIFASSAILLAGLWLCWRGLRRS